MVLEPRLGFAERDEQSLRDRRVGATAAQSRHQLIFRESFIEHRRRTRAIPGDDLQ